MKSILYGGLCLACFILTSAAYSSVQNPQLETEDSASIPAVSEVTIPSQTGLGEEDEKATSLVAVTTKKCGPCRRLKYLTISVLLVEGYDVSLVRQEDWFGPAPERFPTLYYYDDEDGNIIRTEEGFKTAIHVKKYLTK